MTNPVNKPDFNIMCANYLGWEYVPPNGFIFPEGVWKDSRGVGYCAKNGLRFYTDWNWLMMVLQKMASESIEWEVTSRYVKIRPRAGHSIGQVECEFSCTSPEYVVIAATRCIEQLLRRMGVPKNLSKEPEFKFPEGMTEADFNWAESPVLGASLNALGGSIDSHKNLIEDHRYYRCGKHKTNGMVAIIPTTKTYK